MAQKPHVNILEYVKCDVTKQASKAGLNYSVIFPDPCKGILFVTEDSPHFIHGRIAVKGRDDGRYPYHYLEMIDNVFGVEPNTIEVCARTVKPDNNTAFTVDVNPDFKPSKVANAEKLEGIESDRFNRWRADPPYNKETAKTMYGTELPSFIRMLEAGARVCKPNSLMFMLLGPTNYQNCPSGVMRVGLIYISVVPNQETRALNIYLKLPEQFKNYAALDEWL